MTNLTPVYSSIAEFIPDERWQRIYTAWLLELRSQRTRERYNAVWREYLDMMRVSMDKLTTDHAIAFKAALGERLSPASVNQYLSAISSFYEYAVKRHLIDENPVRHKVKHLPVKKYGKASFLTDNEPVTLLKTIQKRRQEAQARYEDKQSDYWRRVVESADRDYAMVMLFLLTAVRRDVISQITISNLEQRSSKVIMHYINKGGDAEKVELPAAVVNALALYFKAWRDDLTPDAPVFRSVDDAGVMDESSVYKRIKYWVREAGLGKKITPHSLRHTAIRMAEKRGYTISELMGFSRHKNPETLMVYLHALTESASGIAKDLGDDLERALNE